MRQPETISPESFIKDAFSAQDPDFFTRLYLLPSALTSYAGFIREYSRARNNTDPTLQMYFDSGPPMLVTLWSYCHVSGRNLPTLAKEDVLLPGIILYRTVIRQDDNLDDFRKGNPDSSAKRSFWYNNGLINSEVFRELFRSAIRLIDTNHQLSLPKRHYMKSCIASAYNTYVKAEDMLVSLRGSKNPDLYQVHVCRTQSYGAMAKAITAIWNGTQCLKPFGTNVEATMAWFEMGVGIMDNELDRVEDRPYTMTPVIAGDELDEKLNLPKGTTAKHLLTFYLNEFGYKDIHSFLLFVRYLYPKIERILKSGKKIFPQLASSLVVERDQPVR